ncbi:general control of amino acid synthesis-like protein [Zopfochytrium polystomum]|nr:general control of amino acid synthesis-like protein [Zopfochytrium polystomum]
MIKVVRDHHAKGQTIAKLSRDRTRQEAAASIADLADALTETLNVRVATAFQAQKDVEVEAKRLQAAVARYNKQTALWVGLVGQLNNALKELGEVRNWAKAIEKDVTLVTDTLAREQQQQQPSAQD